MSAYNIVLLVGWGFLLVSWLWPVNKWGGRTLKIALSALASGVFLANVIYVFWS
jgi:hypothetical protein